MQVDAPVNQQYKDVTLKVFKLKTDIDKQIQKTQLDLADLNSQIKASVHYKTALDKRTISKQTKLFIQVLTYQYEKYNNAKNKPVVVRPYARQIAKLQIINLVSELFDTNNEHEADQVIHRLRKIINPASVIVEE